MERRHATMRWPMRSAIVGASSEMKRSMSHAEIPRRFCRRHRSASKKQSKNARGVDKSRGNTTLAVSDVPRNRHKP